MKRILCFLSVVLLIACDSQSNKNLKIENQINDFYGKSITFSDSLILIVKDNIQTISKSNLLANNNKIVTIVNGSCPSCLNEIAQWLDFHKCLNEKTGIDNLYFILTNIDYSYFKKIYSQNIPFEFQIIIDEENIFIHDNILYGLNISNTILLDNENKIKFIGDPIGNEEISNIYLSII